MHILQYSNLFTKTETDLNALFTMFPDFAAWYKLNKNIPSASEGLKSVSVKEEPPKLDPDAQELDTQLLPEIGPVVEPPTIYGQVVNPDAIESETESETPTPRPECAPIFYGPVVDPDATESETESETPTPQPIFYGPVVDPDATESDTESETPTE